MKFLFSILILPFCLTLLISSNKLYSESQSNKTLAIKYVSSFYASVHQNKSKYSVTLTTVSCGFPVKVLASSQGSDLFFKVKAGAHTGYIKKSNLQESKPSCMQDKYPRFFDQLEFSLEEMHYFGRLNDLFSEGESRVR